MAKLFAYLAAAVCALAGVASAQNATRPPCVPVNFGAKAADIKALNGVIDIAINSGLLAKMLPEPISVNNSAVSVIPFKVLNLNFELTPTIKDLKVGGISKIVPKHLNVSSNSSLTIAADFNGTLSLKANFSISIQQLDLKWYSICWTDAIHKPFTCPPAVIDVEVDIAINKPTLAADVLLNLVGCTPGTPTKVCKDVTVSDILIAALQSKFEPLLVRLLKRFSSASLNSIALDFESISKLDINIGKDGTLVNALLDQLLNFSVTEVNKKGDIYKVVLDVVQKVAKSLVNKLLSDELAPQFGNTCYDA
ncbi:hypothetical protein PybrP1_012591 [[Pythium] brassicae (nom. inval.)]|nr:hypothetical protein PybrP1_012591 [[Pythium] brassicae (nom. inval.)]